MDLAEAVMSQLAVSAHKAVAANKGKIPLIQVEMTAPWRMLAVVSLAQLLGMTLWFSATAVTPLLITEFNIAPSHAAWLTMAVQAGFVAGTLLSARVERRRHPERARVDVHRVAHRRGGKCRRVDRARRRRR